MHRLLIFYISLFLATHVFSQDLRVRTSNVHLSLKNSISKTSVPSMIWISPKLEYSNSMDGHVEIEVQVHSEISLRTLFLAINNNFGELIGSKPISLEANQNDQYIKQNFRLPDGSYSLEIVAENIYGGKISGIRNVIVGGEAIADAISSNRKDYALLFATDIYDNWNDLVNPVNDAVSLAKELKEIYGFEVEIIENASQEEMLVKIKEYSQRNYKPQDQLLIFFAGHGHFDEVFGEGYVVAKNSLEVDKAKTSYISHSNLRSYTNNIQCEHILLVMDVCFGGTLDPIIARSRSTDRGDELSRNAFLARKLSKKTRRFITSGGKEYVSDGLPGQHSPFASRLLEAFKSRGFEDGILTLNEILPFLEKISMHEPRSGEFGDNESGSDFVFVVRQ